MACFTHFSKIGRDWQRHSRFGLASKFKPTYQDSIRVFNSYRHCVSFPQAKMPCMTHLPVFSFRTSKKIQSKETLLSQWQAGAKLEKLMRDGWPNCWYWGGSWITGCEATIPSCLHVSWIPTNRRPSSRFSGKGYRCRTQLRVTSLIFATTSCVREGGDRFQKQI